MANINDQRNRIIGKIKKGSGFTPYNASKQASAQGNSPAQNNATPNAGAPKPKPVQQTNRRKGKGCGCNRKRKGG
tara:strand:+ start:7478 stop:7702 length:225 start_codon:yes stop_codon:yes gene_type:complete